MNLTDPGSFPEQATYTDLLGALAVVVVLLLALGGLLALVAVMVPKGPRPTPRARPTSSNRKAGRL